MEVHHPTKKDFMAKFERFEPVVMDHSAVIVAKQCKRRYFYRIVLGFQEKVTPQFFGFGTCVHKFAEVLEEQYMELAKVERSKSPDLKTRDLPAVQLGMAQVALNATRELWKKKHMRDPVVGDRFDFLTEKRLVESCLEWVKHWQAEKKAGRIEVIATEQNFIVPLPDGSLVAGKADQIIRWNGKVWGRDFKTSSKEQNAYYTRTLDPNDQFTRYTWAEQQLCGEPVQGQLVQVIYNAKGTKATPKKGPKIFTHLATRSQRQIDKWVEEQMFYNKLLKLMRDEDVYPMEEANCAFCPYHSVCKAPSEGAQMAKLEAEFKIEPWDCIHRGPEDD